MTSTSRGLSRVTQAALATAMATLAATGLAACGGETTTSTLTVGATAEPDTLDFSQSANAGIPEVLLYNVYETLYKITSEGDLEPLLATGHTVSDDRLTYTFTLDDKAEFASGAPVDADSVIASIARFTGSPNATVAAPLAKIAKTEAPDARTVVITLKEPSNTWLYDMTLTGGIVVDPAATDLAQTAAGSGPYEFSSWTPGDRITLVRNEDYWKGDVAYDEVVFRYFADPSAMTFALQSGDLDLTANLTSTAVDLFEGEDEYQVFVGSTAGEVVLGFNHDRPAFADLRVRQAINLAIDRQALVDSVWGGYGALIGSMVVPTDPYYEDLSETYPYDPAQAKQLLAAAGATDLTLELRVPADLPYAPPAAQFIASQLGEVGVEVDVEELDFTGGWLPEVYTAGNYDMTIVAHVEPRDIASWASPDYYWHYDNEEFQTLIAEADTGDPDDFVPTMKEAAKVLADDAAASFLFVLPQIVVARAGLTGVPENTTTVSFDITTVRG
ncbi:MAG: ABC transporter substrate-binding protein [Propionibacteriaceae bacterium]|jgi:peptide/nickel transport system substrate-binding protein|nr:ABC transporter substrate-binding protein [Propionibacteriaceae bacterium]